MNLSISKVLWIVDENGNNGKSTLAQFLKCAYGYLCTNGSISSRDLAVSFDVDIKGVVVDTKRSGSRNIDYETLEGLKDGDLSTGKYEGRFLTFEPLKVLVLSNEAPDQTRLSRDRWDIHYIGSGILADTTSISDLNISDIYPFCSRPEFPDLLGHQNLDEYLKSKGILNVPASNNRENNGESADQNGKFGLYFPN